MAYQSLKYYHEDTGLDMRGGSIYNVRDIQVEGNVSDDYETKLQFTNQHKTM